MDRLHPTYHILISDFIARDPLYFLRKNVDAIRLNKKPADATNILEEHFRYTKTILERVRNEQEQRQQLEIMLTIAREQFAETDTALSHAQTLVTGLNSDLKQSQAHSDDVILNMEQSRSWRYTAWLRKK
jgi:hypothetical protein